MCFFFWAIFHYKICLQQFHSSAIRSPLWIEQLKFFLVGPNNLLPLRYCPFSVLKGPQQSLQFIDHECWLQWFSGTHMTEQSSHTKSKSNSGKKMLHVQSMSEANAARAKHDHMHNGCTCNPKLHEQVPVVAHAAEFLFSWEVTAFAHAKLVFAPRASLNNCDQECT